MKPTGYTIKHTPRPAGSGGGVAIIYKTELNVQNGPLKCFFIECALTTCKSCPPTHRCCLPPRPPPASNNWRTTPDLFEWGHFIDQHNNTTYPFVVIGDLSFHLDDDMDPDTRRLTHGQQTTCMMMHVHRSTLRKGYTLDVLDSLHGRTRHSPCCDHGDGTNTSFAML